MEIIIISESDNCSCQGCDRVLQSLATKTFGSDRSIESKKLAVGIVIAIAYVTSFTWAIHLPIYTGLLPLSSQPPTYAFFGMLLIVVLCQRTP